MRDKAIFVQQFYDFCDVTVEDIKISTVQRPGANTPRILTQESHSRMLEIWNEEELYPRTTFGPRYL